jgi:hypothetical protein
MRGHTLRDCFLSRSDFYVCFALYQLSAPGASAREKGSCVRYYKMRLLNACNVYLRGDFFRGRCSLCALSHSTALMHTGAINKKICKHSAAIST